MSQAADDSVDSNEKKGELHDATKSLKETYPNAKHNIGKTGTGKSKQIGDPAQEEVKTSLGRRAQRRWSAGDTHAIAQVPTQISRSKSRRSSTVGISEATGSTTLWREQLTEAYQKYQSWEDIPLDFFVDQNVPDDIGSISSSDSPIQKSRKAGRKKKATTVGGSTTISKGACTIL